MLYVGSMPSIPIVQDYQVHRGLYINTIQNIAEENKSVSLSISLQYPCLPDKVS
jgi:hypothetical protein